MKLDVQLASLAELGLPLLVLGADSGTFTNAAAMQRETEEAGGRFELLHCLHWPLTECRPAVEAGINKVGAAVLKDSNKNQP